jgi:DNA-binding transcriptional LysR family regulator
MQFATFACKPPEPDALRDATLTGLGLAYLSTWLAADGLLTGRLECVLTPEFA